MASRTRTSFKEPVRSSPDGQLYARPHAQCIAGSSSFRLSLPVTATGSPETPVPPSPPRTGSPPLHRQQLRKLRPLLRHYWHRIVGVSLSWFVWDVTFFGNKLFQGTFIKVGSDTERKRYLCELLATSMRRLV